MQTFFTYTSPYFVNVHGALQKFTGLMMVRSPAGETYGDDCSCGGGCMAIVFRDGIYYEAKQVVPGKCPGEYPSGFAPAFTSLPGSAASVGHRWGNPDDLLANLGEDGCCYSHEIDQAPPVLDFNSVEQYTYPVGTARQQIATLTSQNQDIQSLLTSCQTTLALRTAALTARASEVVALTGERNGLRAEVYNLEQEIIRLNALLVGSGGGAGGSGVDLIAAENEKALGRLTIEPRETRSLEECAEVDECASLEALDPLRCLGDLLR